MGELMLNRPPASAWMSRGEVGDLLLHVPAHLGQERAVDLHPRALHVGQDFHQRQLHLRVDAGQPLFVEALRQRLFQAQRDVRVLGGGGGGRGRG